MATREQVAQLRLLTDYTAVDPYDDAQLAAMIDASSVDSVAARLWEEKASKAATMVNISESGSSRSMGDIHKNALNMAAYFKKKVQDAETPVDEGRFARTRAIVREG